MAGTGEVVNLARAAQDDLGFSDLEEVRSDQIDLKPEHV